MEQALALREPAWTPYFLRTGSSLLIRIGTGTCSPCPSAPSRMMDQHFLPRGAVLAKAVSAETPTIAALPALALPETLAAESSLTGVRVGDRGTIGRNNTVAHLLFKGGRFCGSG